ncbi:5-formyltetrahydrofolate cyclo-ligase [Tenacibaculum pacificus]|uniref:5-formyltetrahydrofolate cyclo-ligase n=1 Tax=Tenacibaculum pacificus TaxID=3018314 RepID=UPI0022F3F4FB|nr:5-formyltetrahydrofolate cyclo-ligase [Tenacibaculum pacificus]WBX74176.1 5-formyltetrahydrofolate cyclo-ligase [Tenacibaculum pacificus]
MNKTALRNIYKEKRKSLSEKEIHTFEKNIYKQIFDIDFSNIQNIHVFLSIKNQKEIDTYPIIDYLRSLNKTIIISKSNFSDNTLEHSIFDKNTTLEISKYGIPEPINAKKFEVKNIDLVFVPLLISDKQNYRVGYGKGFYDRFLSNCKKDIITIGLNFFEPITEITDSNNYDIPLNNIIFPI